MWNYQLCRRYFYFPCYFSIFVRMIMLLSQVHSQSQEQCETSAYFMDQDFSVWQLPFSHSYCYVHTGPAGIYKPGTTPEQFLQFIWRRERKIEILDYLFFLDHMVNFRTK